MQQEKTDKNTNISYFKEKVFDFIQERDWTKYHDSKNLIQAIQIEAAELSELFLFKNPTSNEILRDETLLGRIKEEIADVFIYLISFINSLDIDLTEAFVEKMRKNRIKYPVEEFNNGIYYKK